MAHWASFLLDVSKWSLSAGFLWEGCFNFGSMFNHPAPLLRKLSLKSKRDLFYNTPLLSAVRFNECLIRLPMDFSRIKRLWIDHWVKSEPRCAYWEDLVNLEELTLQIWWDIDIDPDLQLDDVHFTPSGSSDF